MHKQAGTSFCKLGDASGLVQSGPRIKLFHRTLNCFFYRLLRALIGGQVNERASSGNVINWLAEAVSLQASKFDANRRFQTRFVRC
jgi:hypothetical protein